MWYISINEGEFIPAEGGLGTEFMIPKILAMLHVKAVVMYTDLMGFANNVESNILGPLWMGSGPPPWM